MDFISVVERVIQRLDKEGVRYALIGGFAMGLRGVQRATVDLDFILMLDDLSTADQIFTQSGYKRTFHSENVSHYESSDLDLGRIDILHAFRGPSLSMLKRADRVSLSSELSLPVVQVEDLIGLKIQAATNDPSRASSDWLDIRLLIENAGQNKQSIDWDLIGDYLDLFGKTDKLEELRKLYGSLN
ncbi:nucleotidyl transferase AbiEii/AbiGii toxin family protein [Puniceicoccales bacterium CK1056]|uniref:Nucleotidyl transferase AbiEii/AbiGii toxin family protein n=1 Tax=Oceanipulchritudo coccoides TaxID=2706888 RepID=A0A6B2M4E2_9BACT|nr:nucleotidyltransferase [Oceanipulchritudo coccoides]NDV62974.1 nucleotidyl transferase AbiEii/AbiGii toxin family protein [Oceanipulchritudo coccoides]